MAIDINVPSQIKNYANLAAFPATGTLKTIFIAEDTNKTYRWTGSVYVEISGVDLSGYVPTSRTLTINGTTQDLSANRTFTVATGITIGTTAITSGVVGRVLFEGAGNVVQESANLFWDNTNGRLGIGGTPGAFALDVNGTARVQDSVTVSRNQNAATTIAISNTTSGTSAQSALLFNANTGIYKYSASTTTYKIFNANDFGHYNSASGDISILNDVGGGRIKFATGASSSAQMTLASTGNLLINTTTDAGFTLDVNGTARVQGNTTIGTTTTPSTTLNIFSSSRADLRLKTNGNSDNAFAVYAIGGAFGSCSAQFGTNDGENASHQGGAIYTDSRTGLVAPIRLVVKATGTTAMSTAMSIFNTTNVGINTTTDAGFRLDVNGTARVSGAFTSTSTITSTNTITGANLVSTSNIQVGAILYGTNFSISNNGQTAIGAGGFNAPASALVAFTSTTQGFLPPRMTTTQKNAIATPVAGLMVYDTTLNLISVYNGSTWITL